MPSPTSRGLRRGGEMAGGSDDRRRRRRRRVARGPAASSLRPGRYQRPSPGQYRRGPGAAAVDASAPRGRARDGLAGAGSEVDPQRPREVTASRDRRPAAQARARAMANSMWASGAVAGRPVSRRPGAEHAGTRWPIRNVLPHPRVEVRRERVAIPVGQARARS